MKKPLNEFDVVFMNDDNGREISLVAKASAYLERKCGLKCAIPGRDYLYGFVRDVDIVHYLRKCNSAILTFPMIEKLNLYKDNDKSTVVLIEDFERCPLDLRRFIPIEVSICEHIWLSQLAKSLYELSPSK